MVVPTSENVQHHEFRRLDPPGDEKKLFFVLDFVFSCCFCTVIHSRKCNIFHVCSHALKSAISVSLLVFNRPQSSLLSSFFCLQPRIYRVYVCGASLCRGAELKALNMQETHVFNFKWGLNVLLSDLQPLGVFLNPWLIVTSCTRSEIKERRSCATETVNVIPEVGLLLS